MRQMTFDIPEDLAERVTSEVPASEQSVLVEKFWRRQVSRPKLTDEQWAAACEAANNDPETQQIQAEFDALPDTMTTEPWIDDSAAR